VLHLDAFARNAIDVRRLVAHEPARVGAYVRDADVVAPHHEDVGLFAPGRRRCRRLCLRLRFLHGGNEADGAQHRKRRAGRQEAAPVGIDLLCFVAHDTLLFLTTHLKPT
jgi:hypothetical protein